MAMADILGQPTLQRTNKTVWGAERLFLAKGGSVRRMQTP
jgi:hypothetical protein